MRFYHGVMPPKGAHGMANSVDPDQTAPLGKLRIITVPYVLKENVIKEKNTKKKNSVDPYQTAHSDGIHCLLFHICLVGLGIDQFFRYDICINTN